MTHPPPPTLFEHALSACVAAAKKTHKDASIISRRDGKNVLLTCGLREGKPVVYESQEWTQDTDDGTTPRTLLERIVLGIL